MRSYVTFVHVVMGKRKIARGKFILVLRFMGSGEAMPVLGRAGGSAPPQAACRVFGCPHEGPAGGRSVLGSPEGTGRIAGMVSCGYFQPRARLGDLGS